MHRSFGRASLSALLALAGLSAPLATPTHAQYMYLDANGDGVHTEADLLPSTGVTTVEIWLITDRNRDGSAARCAVDGSAAMTINSYEVILRPVGGTVSWANFTNLVPSATTSFGYRSDPSELYAGYGGGEILPPGTYRLARLDVIPLTGAPSLVFGRSSRLYPPAYTSFGCACIGIDQDNTLKLGQEWLDAVGLLAPNASHTPVVDPVADQVMQEAEARSIAIGAGDADGSTMTLDIAPRLVFARYSESRNEPGRVEGTLSLTPGYADSGSYALTIRADDGVHIGEGSFRVTVLDKERPIVPNFPPEVSMLPPALGVPPGAVRDVRVWAIDPDGDPLSLTLAGAPSFASLATKSAKPGRTDALLHLAPTMADAGSWPVEIVASDGAHSAARNVNVNVGPNHPPSLDPIPSILTMEWRIAYSRVWASDADWDSIATGFRDAPAFMTRTPAGGFGFVGQDVVVEPRSGDAGDYVFYVTASDPYSRVEQPVHLTVLPAGNLPVAWTPKRYGTCVEQGTSRYLGMTATDAAGTPLSIAVEHAPAWVSSEAAGPDAIMLTIAPGIDEPPAEEYVVLRASNPSGEWGAWLISLSLRPPGTCFVYCGTCASVGNKPVAVAGGPYHGYVGDPITLDGRWSTEGSEPPGYSWRPGDDSYERGPVAKHVYAASGRYQAVLTVGNHYGLSRDTADVFVQDPVPARVFLWPGSRVVALADSKASMELRVEPLDPEHEAASLILGASCLRAEGLGQADSIGAVPAKSSVIGDADENGRPDVGVSFSMADLKCLFASIRGKREVSAQFETRAADGAPVRGTLALTVLGLPSTGIQIGPNPFNPSGTIAFEVETACPVRVRQFDVTGRLVRTFLDEAAGRPGPRVVTIDGRDGVGRPLASGVYFFKIERGARVDRARVIILK